MGSLALLAGCTDDSTETSETDISPPGTTESTTTASTGTESVTQQTTTQNQATTHQPADLQVTVVGSQFEWQFDYGDSGVSGCDELVLPVDTAISLSATATDVMHSFSVAPLGLKIDAIPGETSTVRVTPEETGQYTGFCTELCGSGHSEMMAPVRVVSEADFEGWI